MEKIYELWQNPKTHCLQHTITLPPVSGKAKTPISYMKCQNSGNKIVQGQFTGFSEAGKGKYHLATYIQFSHSLFRFFYLKSHSL